MDIVFFGSGAFGIPSLEALWGSGHRILHVVSQPDRKAGRGKQMTPTAVSAWALEHGVALLRTEDASGADVVGLMRSLQPGGMVVIAFGQKLSEELLGVSTHRAINLHSSLLPRYRGAAPINWAVIDNEKAAGVSVIEVTAVMDAGDIFAAASVAVGAEETAGELHDRLAVLGAGLVPGVLDALAAGTAVRVVQDGRLATRAPKLSREQAWVDFGKSAEAVSARLRGMSPWPGVQVRFRGEGDEELAVATILKCRAKGAGVHGAEDWGLVLGDLSIACGEGAIEMLSLQPAGKRAMAFSAFVNGHRIRAGCRVESVMAARG